MRYMGCARNGRRVFEAVFNSYDPSSAYKLNRGKVLGYILHSMNSQLRGSLSS
jgi:hypothetical protein